MEIWDAYDSQRIKQEQDLVRGETIPEGLYHLVVEVIVQHEDKSILFMKRDEDKASYPAHFEATAGGSALKSEDSLTAIHRELSEETGLVLDIKAFKLCHQSTNHEHACLFDIFHGTTDCDKSNIQLQAGETSGFIWVELENLQQFLETELVIPRQKEFLETYFLR